MDPWYMLSIPTTFQRSHLGLGRPIRIPLIISLGAMVMNTTNPNGSNRLITMLSISRFVGHFRFSEDSVVKGGVFTSKKKLSSYTCHPMPNALEDGVMGTRRNSVLSAGRESRTFCEFDAHLWRLNRAAFCTMMRSRASLISSSSVAQP